MKDKHICDICNQNYATNNNLSRHKREIHSANPRRHVCPCCQFTTLRKESLRIHLK